MNKWLSTMIILLLVALPGSGQSPDSISVDTVRLTKAHSPKKALILSMVLPGAGQLYNRKLWKVPIVYGALAIPFYYIGQNRDGYQEFRKILADRQAGIRDDLYTSVYDDNGIRTIRDGYRKNLELSYFSFVFIHLLNGVDAFVDAHLRSFDIREELTFDFHLDPGPVPGISMVITF